jgi:hypothetical protein
VKKTLLFFVSCILLVLPGCLRPMEPIDLQVIGTNEEAFLIPLTGNHENQVSTGSEELLRKNLV